MPRGKRKIEPKVEEKPAKKKRTRKPKAVETQIVKEIVKKRKRRTKAEMEAARAQQAAIPVINRKQHEEAVVKVRRKRRTKAEMEAARAKQEQDERKYIDEVLKNTKSKGIIIRFHNYVLSKFDDFNLMLEYKPKETTSLFLGYYKADINGFITALESMASRLLANVTNASKAAAVSNLNILLMALHDFKLFLHSKFVMSKDDRPNNNV